MKTNAIFSKKQLFGVCCALLLSPMAVFGQLIVGKSLGADHTADEQKALAVTKNGDMYISINANSFQIMKDDGTFDEIKNPYQESITRAGILTKISADGKLLWSNMVCVQESANNSQVTSVCEVGDYLYVVGGVRTNVKGEHPVSVFGIPLVSQGEMDYYIAKLNAATGEAVWAKTFGGVRNWEMFNSVVADEAGNLYAVATFGNVSSAPLEMPLKDGSSTSLAVTNNWGEDYLLVKFNKDGEILWATGIGSKFRENGTPDVTVGEDGNPVICGVFNAANGNLTNESEEKREFYIGEQKYLLYPEQSKESALVKLNSTDGSVMWSRYFTGTGNQEVLKVQAVSGSNAVAVTGKANNQIIVEGSAGLSTETVTHVSGADHLFVISFDVDGKLLWSKSASGDTSSEGKEISSDDLGNIYVSGYFNGSLNWGDNIVLQKTGSNEKEGFFAKLNGSGKCLYAETVKGTGAESINLIAVNGDKLAVAGDRTTDVTLPYGDSETGVARYTVGDRNYKWFAASYTMKPSVSGISTLNGKRFVPFSYQIVPAFFEMPAVFEYSLAGNLPSGWILDPATGIISGKATEEASGSFSVMISNATDGESVEKTYTYSIVPKPCDILSIQPESLPSRAVTGAFYQQFTLENGEGKIVWTAENLPKGLSLDPDKGLLNGILQQTGELSFTIKAREESGCETSRSYTINAEEFNYSLAPNLKWINQIYGSEAFDHAKVNSIDKDGNVWVAASYFSATFSDEVSFPNIGNTDALVAKYNGIDGSFMWARTIGGSPVSGRNEQGQAIVTDVVTGDGVFTGIITPDARIGTLNETDSFPTNGGRDIGVIRFDKDGNKIWHKVFGSAKDWEAGINTTFDKKGNIYVIGYTNDGDIVIPMADGSSETLAGTSVDVVIIKLNGDGEGLWAKRLGTVNKGEEIYGLVTDDACNVYVSGMVNNGTVPFGNGKVVTATGITSFIAKYDEAGVCQWVTSLGSNGSLINGRGTSLVRDKNGNLYFAAICKGSSSISGTTETIEGDASKTDGAIIKFNSDGQYVWHRMFASVADDGVTSLAVDESNNVYAVGYYEAELPVYESIKLQRNGNNRTAFVAKYSDEGEYLYAFSTGAIITDAVKPTGLAISIDKTTNDIILTGPTYGTIYPYGVSGSSNAFGGGRFMLARYSQDAALFGIFPQGIKGESYSAQLNISGFQKPLQVAYSLKDGDNLPDGLSLDTNTGEISGVLNEAGIFKFTVLATDGFVNASKEFSISVTGADCQMTVEAIISEDAENGKPFSARIYADNATGAVTWSIEEGSSLPYGLSISSLEDGVGLISGTPNAPAKEYSFTIVAEDEAGCRVTQLVYLNVTGESGVETLVSEGFVVYPNPVTDGMLKVSLKDLVSGNYVIEIADLSGKQVYKEEVRVEENMVKSISVNNMPSQWYVVTVRGMGVSYSQRFMVQ
ncbi:MAG: putative Ig domain-containing protein [Barnesiella sp.]|nr:putative Ig domain-containing protein [Barnesiella sp.]